MKSCVYYELSLVTSRNKRYIIWFFRLCVIILAFVKWCKNGVEELEEVALLPLFAILKTGKWEAAAGLWILQRNRILLCKYGIYGHDMRRSCAGTNCSSILWGFNSSITNRYSPIPSPPGVVWENPIFRRP